MLNIIVCYRYKLFKKSIIILIKFDNNTINNNNNASECIYLKVVLRNSK